MSEPLYAGIDAGSSATKCVVIDQAGALVGHEVVPSGFSYAEAAEHAMAGALEPVRGQLADGALRHQVDDTHHREGGPVPGWAVIGDPGVDAGS